MSCARHESMTQPRIITPGATHFITRRTVGRYHLFAPDPRIRQVFLYSLAVAAERKSIAVHLAMLMSTHEHLVVTDVAGQLPGFLQLFHRIVGLATKALRKWEGPVWDHRKCSIVELLTPQAVVEKIAYGIANPVTAGLVRRAGDWPGVKVRVDEPGVAVWRIERPPFFFDPENESWPDLVELRLTFPPAAHALGTPERFRELVQAEVERLESVARIEAKTSGSTFLGPERCANLSPFRRARTREPARALNPTFAVGRGRREERRFAVACLRRFRTDYRVALSLWRSGDRLACFPAGTWLMKVLHAAPVATEDS